MGTIDELRASFGPDFFSPENDREQHHNWLALCVCGHTARYHSPSTGDGASYRVSETSTTLSPRDGAEWTNLTVFDGCVGALKPRGFEEITNDRDEDTHTVTARIHPTCPCTEFRPVAQVDRPNRFFNQRMPRADNRPDPARHPFQVGCRALRTHLSKRKAAQKDPAWADREFDRRFGWLPDARVCGISRCTETDDVWPVFVDTDRASDRSELRCAKHR